MSSPAAAERAALAIGRLDAALDGHPLRKAWEHRTRLAAAVRAAAWNGQAVQPDRLAGIVAGVPYRPLDDCRAEHNALLFFDGLAQISDGERLFTDLPDGEPDDLAEDLAVFLAAVAPGGGALLPALAEAAWEIRRQPGTRPGVLQAAIPLLLARHGATRSGVVLGLAAYPAAAARLDWHDRFLDGLTQAADDGLGRLRRLAMTAEAWHHRLGPRQKNSRLPHLVAAALCHPRLTPVGVQALFGTTSTVDAASGARRRRPAMSLPGASKLLNELVRLGILTEGTERRGSHRLFLAADLGVGRGSDIKRATPTSPELPRQMGGQYLDELLDGVEASLRRSATLLARHGLAPADPDAG